ncbi:hypothetical protein [Mycoplasma suis]|uniref:Uncharacterized protein n=1 Tax=Mycoplasma suis (strain Illinois) TaxID=768700 RepID=F0QQG8_MYCSL|nr:hypothetical protein [Mycoplasma suis]ADX97738.1 hypothetical protein MSU_0194 [Mycoplasma suis str. Illinois]
MKAISLVKSLLTVFSASGVVTGSYLATSSGKEDKQQPIEQSGSHVTGGNNYLDNERGRTEEEKSSEKPKPVVITQETKSGETVTYATYVASNSDYGIDEGDIEEEDEVQNRSEIVFQMIRKTGEVAGGKSNLKCTKLVKGSETSSEMDEQICKNLISSRWDSENKNGKLEVWLSVEKQEISKTLRDNELDRKLFFGDKKKWGTRFPLFLSCELKENPQEPSKVIVICEK